MTYYFAFFKNILTSHKILARVEVEARVIVIINKVRKMSVRDKK